MQTEEAQSLQRANRREEQLVACILDIGELLLTSGAEIMRVEDTMAWVCAVYGFTGVHVFTITSSIVLTAHTPAGRVLTQTRRIHARDTDLGRVESINALSRRLCAAPLEPDMLRREVEAVRSTPAWPLWVQCAMYGVISAAFSVFFGGTARDGLTAALSGVLLFFALRFGRRLRLNSILLSFLCSALAALAVMGLVWLGLGQNPDKIIIGNIMLLIPGIALTASLRDMINGDTISGLLGISEAVLKALAVAAGFAAVLLHTGG
ncbi:MAG: threonine/serine exporter family protein [Oscillospiraceae bacterium]